MANSSEASYARVRGWLVPAALTASVLASLDLFVVNMAFAAISASFPTAGPQAMAWILNAYGIAFGALLVPAGRLADRFGVLRLFRIGLVTFAAGSLLSAFAPDIAVLIGARAVQGVGAALIVPTSLALLLARYPRPRHKSMVSIWGAAGSVAAAAGPVLGGVLSEYDWRWIFLVNVPLAALALLFTRGVDHDTPITARTPDLLGVGLLAVGIAAAVTALSYVTDWGVSSPLLWAAVAVSVGATAWFIRRCVTRPVPAMDLRVFREPTFTVAVVGMVAFYVGLAVMLLGGSLFLTHVWAWNPVLAGVGFAAGPGTAVIAALAVGRTRLAPRTLAVIGGACFTAAGLLWYLFLDSGSGYFPVMLPGLVLAGAGAGIAQIGFLAGGVSRLSARSYATGTGVLNMSRQIGAALGVAALIAATGAGTDPDAYRAAWIVLACSGAVSAGLALLIRHRPSLPAQAEPALAAESGTVPPAGSVAAPSL